MKRLNQLIIIMLEKQYCSTYGSVDLKRLQERVIAENKIHYKMCRLLQRDQEVKIIVKALHYLSFQQKQSSEAWARKIVENGTKAKILEIITARGKVDIN